MFGYGGHQLLEAAERVAVRLSHCHAWLKKLHKQVWCENWWFSSVPEHSCLWNHKSESYRNRLLRQSLLETLSSILSNNEPVSFTGNTPAALMLSPHGAFNLNSQHLCHFSSFSGRHKDEVQEPANHLPAWTQGGELQQNVRLGGLLPPKVEALPWPHVPLRLLRRGWAARGRPLLPAAGHRSPPYGQPSPTSPLTLPCHQPNCLQAEHAGSQSPPLTYTPRLPALLPFLVPLPFHIFLPHRQQSIWTQTREPPGNHHRGAGPHEDTMSDSSSVPTRRVPEVCGGVSEWDAAWQSEEAEEEDNRDDSQHVGGCLVCLFIHFISAQV